MKLTMYHETRKIASIHTGQEAIYIGSGGVTCIYPYYESDDSLWFRVERMDGSIQRRVNSKFVESVFYETEDN